MKSLYLLRTNRRREQNMASLRRPAMSAEASGRAPGWQPEPTERSITYR